MRKYQPISDIRKESKHAFYSSNNDGRIKNHHHHHQKPPVETQSRKSFSDGSLYNAVKNMISKKDYKSVLEKLKQFMYAPTTQPIPQTRIQPPQTRIQPPQTRIQPPQPHKKPIPEFMSKDKLYMIYRKLVPPAIDISNFDSKWTILEANEKIGIVERLRKCVKPGKKLEKYESYLSAGQKINMETFTALCKMDNLSVALVFDDICVCVSGGGEKIHQFTNYVYNGTVDGLPTNKFIVENPEKPLKSISTYKLADLIDIATVLHINHEKMKKPDLYEAIQSKIVKQMPQII